MILRLLILMLAIASHTYSQDLYREIQPETGQNFLIGPIGLEQLEQEPYSSWFHKNFENYELQASLLPPLKEALAKHHILVFLGTWCGDSKREVPRFFKILEKAGFPKDRIKIIAVDRREPNVKKSPYGEEWGLQIKRVPTFIFLKDGREVNRIVESPVESLESDMLKILNQADYTPNYAEMMKSE